VWYDEIICCIASHHITSHHITSHHMINRAELREEMKRGLKERDTDARILINEKGVLKDKIQKMEVCTI
jgi:hypothetical protein